MDIIWPVNTINRLKVPWKYGHRDKLSLVKPAAFGAKKGAEIGL
jgi:hypothetical protein